MANAFQSAVSGLAELKPIFQGPIVDQLNNDLPIYRGAEKMKKGWSGEYVVRPLRVRRNQGIGATSDGGLLPASGRQGTVRAQINVKYNYLVFGITAGMIKASQNDRGSFVRGATYELEEGYKDLASDVNRQLSWNGNGRLAQLSANVVASNVITVIGREGTSEEGSKFLDVDMVVDVVTSAGAIVASGLQITALTVGSTATVTLSGPVTASSGDFLIRSGSLNNEIQGLLTALDGGTSTIYAVDRSLYPAYQGNVLNAGGAQLTLDRMQQAWNEGLRRGGSANGKYSAIYCDFDSQRFYQKLLTADKRYMNTMKGDGGFASASQSYLEFNGIPIVSDKDCPQRMFFLPTDVIEAWVMSEMEVADETGTMYIAQTSSDSFQVRVRFFMNLFNAQPAACSVIRNYISP